jgi:hypothetical protein
LVVAPVQSESAWQSLRPWVADSQTFCAPATRDLCTQAWPIVVSHFVSLAQKIGHVFALWQTLPPAP